MRKNASVNGKTKIFLPFTDTHKHLRVRQGKRKMIKREIARFGQKQRGTKVAT
jgi:hypothetical protein